jgi:hypothetical protein
MFAQRQIISIVLLAAASVVVYAQDASKKDPKTGKDCVTLMSSQLTDTGQTRMYFRNTCPTLFQIQIPVGKKVRENSIEAGTPEKPSNAYVTCSADDRCVGAKWQY